MDAAEQYFETVSVLRRRIVDLEEMAYLDPLTSLYNRRAFDERIVEAISHAKRIKDGMVSLAIIDLDNFKAINDGFGHAAGDECLKNLAGILRSSARIEDVVCRVGGEEFAVILPGASEDDALIAIRRMAEELRKQAIDGAQPITFSAGVVCWMERGYRTPANEAAKLYEQADRAMYEVKRNGKDRVSGCLESMGAAT